MPINLKLAIELLHQIMQDDQTPLTIRIRLGNVYYFLTKKEPEKCQPIK